MGGDPTELSLRQARNSGAERAAPDGAPGIIASLPLALPLGRRYTGARNGSLPLVPRKKNSKPDSQTLAEAARVCACFNFRKASRAVTQLFDAVLQPSGLRSTQFVILVRIGADGRPSLPDLARGLNVDRTTLTRNLQPLVRQGLLRISQGRGERASNVRLTPKGGRALAAAVPLWVKAQTRFVGQFGGQRWPSMLEDLNRVVVAAHGA